MQYKVIKQKRKTVAITIDDGLRINVKVPYFLSMKQIDAFVKEHEVWIMQTLAKKKQWIETKDWYYSGEMMYLGNYYPVQRITEPFHTGCIDFNEEAL